MSNTKLSLKREDDLPVGNVANGNSINESHNDRAKRLGVNVHRGNKFRSNRQEEVYENEYSQAQMSGNVSPTENVNIVEGNNSYIGDESDDLAIQKANQLSVSDQNPYVTENPSSAAVGHGYEEPRRKRKGTGFLGKNTRRMKKENNSNRYA